jgi:hypothetical protein
VELGVGLSDQHRLTRIPSTAPGGVGQFCLGLTDPEREMIAEIDVNRRLKLFP